MVSQGWKWLLQHGVQKETWVQKLDYDVATAFFKTEITENKPRDMTKIIIWVL